MKQTVRQFHLIWVVVPVLGAAAAFISGCGKSGASAPGTQNRTHSVEVELAPLVQRSVRETIDVSGTFFAEEDVIISAKLGGRVLSVPRDIGDAAAQGELLAQIDRRDYELAQAEQRAALTASLAQLGLTQIPDEQFDPSKLPTVTKARAQAANAKARFERSRELFEQKPALIPEQDFSDARTSWDVANSEADVAILTAQATLAEARRQAAALEIAAQRLADTAVTAPRLDDRPALRYRVAERMVSVGELVAAGRPMFRLVATDRLKYRVRVPQRFTGKVTPDQEAQVRGEAGDQSGRVSRVSPVVDPESRTFAVEILIDNKNGSLKPGAFGEGVIAIGVRENAALVPERAVSSFAGVHRVYSVSGGKAVEHQVTLGVREDGMVEVVGNVDVDAVVVSGLTGLAPGVEVRVRKAAAAKDDK